MRATKNLIRLFLLGLTAAFLLQACSSIDGDFAENAIPRVNFVNNEPDADESEFQFHIEQYNFAFLDSLSGFSEASPARFPAPGATATENVRFQLINYQYFQVVSIDSIYVRDENGDYAMTVDPSLYQLDPNIGRYLWITQPAAADPFHWALNTHYVIAGEFKYQPVYSFSPMIFWVGSDPDGFVEQYRYMNVEYTTDAALQSLLSSLAADPDMDLEWSYTQNTQAVINLDTSLGQIRKHVMLVQAIDNLGAVSEPDTRIFNRSNRAPNTPRLTYQKDGFSSLGQPSEYTRRVINWDDFIGDASIANNLASQTPYATLPSFYRPVDAWNGIRFLVAGDDPDDQAFVTIPLQFRYRLVKFDENSDSLDYFRSYDGTWEDDGHWVGTYTDSTGWVSDHAEWITLSESNVIDYEDAYGFDADGWSDNSILELYNLDSGWYQLMVWTRDDGLEACATPAWMRFKVQRMERTPEKGVLLMNWTPTSLPPATAWNVFGGRSHGELGEWYRDLIDESYVSLGANPADLRWNTEFPDDFTLRYWQPGETADSLGHEAFPSYMPFEEMCQYKVVICVDDGYKGNSSRITAINDYFRVIAMDYLDLGGNLFWTGHSSLAKSFGYNPTDINNTQQFLTTNSGDFLGNYMGIQDVYIDQFLTFQNSIGDGMTAAIPEFDFLDTLRLNQAVIDTMRGDGNTFFDGRFDDGDEQTPFDWRSPLPGDCVPYIESFSVDDESGTESMYTYNSYSANVERRQVFDFFEVIDASDPSRDFLFAPVSQGGLGLNFPREPGPNGCWIWIPNTERNLQDMTIFSTFEAHNISRPDNMWAQVIQDVQVLDTDNRWKVHMYLQHQTISDTTDYWAVGDTVSVDLEWDPVLDKHRKVTMCFTENTNSSGGFGPFGGFATYTNFRTAFNTVPLYLMEEGGFGTVDPSFGLLPGSGYKGLMEAVIASFYEPKIQDLLEGN